MGEYRFFRINQAGLVDSGQRVRLMDDDAAITHARDISGGGIVEVWTGSRRIVRLPPQRFGPSG